ncbi:helix-turn-helix domain-containing protein [Hoyosella sp. G463]|uniref:Helix-turn-helix domain-containing protein n=1 Tax=Lolliginicoccus lacisalsi TaxID=2742202 RepID=A0A927JAF6_9ACTN|nr:helix-turn-helix domain-containing protein [Lolliginicoccus lacisalsi]MBD8505528.1 helix-turn-helix domain-containing protein [Lolliginicoccus lacisalsi]
MSKLDDLPLTITVAQSADLLGISRAKAFQLARDGGFPGRIVRIGRENRVVTASLADLGRVSLTDTHNTEKTP